MTKSLPWIIGGLLLAGTAQAQTDQAQFQRPPGTAELNSNLARLASNPRDVSALIGAGEAALALDDAHGAAGFFARADAIESGNGRIKAGLARVMLKLNNPAESLRLFDQAARLGFPDATILTDRALAKDMAGDQTGAQRDYQAAIARTPDDAELRRRYAASLGISGQVEAADKILEPLLYRSDRSAWRYRAFIYAMNNRQAEARKLSEQTMPAQLAAAIEPYMQKMPYLLPAQKAAAIHFGQFPRQVGASIAAIVPTPPAPGVQLAQAVPPPAASKATATPTPTRALSRSEQRRQQREAARIARAEGRVVARPARQVAAAATPTPTPTPAPSPAPARQTLAQATVPTPPPTQSTPAPVPHTSAPPATPQPQTVQTPPTPSVAQPPTPVRQAAAAPVQGPPAPGFDSIAGTATPVPAASPPSSPTTLAQASEPAPTPGPSPSATPLPAAPSPTPAPQPDPAATRTLADIIRAIDVPDTERETRVAAVDLEEIAALQAQRRAERQTAAKLAADKAKKEATAKAKAEADAKAKKEAEEKKKLAANPARSWLQVGVGQSKSALGFTMKGLRRKYASLAAQDAWSAAWGRTNRLLVGPFASFTKAKALEDKLKAAGADVFAWRSDAGEVVEKLGGE